MNGHNLWYSATPVTVTEALEIGAWGHDGAPLTHMEPAPALRDMDDVLREMHRLRTSGAETIFGVFPPELAAMFTAGAAELAHIKGRGDEVEARGWSHHIPVKTSWVVYEGEPAGHMHYAFVDIGCVLVPVA